MRRKYLVLPVILAVVALLGACGATESEPTATAAPATVVETGASPTTSATADASAGSAATDTAPPEAEAEEPLPVLVAGALTSYVAEIEYVNEVLKPQPTVASEGTITMRYSAEPAPGVLEMTVTDTTSEDESGTMKIILVGADMYLWSAEQGDQWIKMPRSEDFAENLGTMLVDPDQLASDAPSDIFSASNVVSRRETVDGVATTHYRVRDEQIYALMGEEAAEVLSGQQMTGQIDLWVANQGNYLKRYALQAQVTEEDGAESRSEITMTVTDVNEPVTVEAPAPADVIDLSSFGGATPES